MAIENKTRNKITYIPASLPAEGLVRLPSVLAALGICRTTFLGRVKSGEYPQPVRLGARLVAWRVSDIRELIDSLGA